MTQLFTPSHSAEIDDRIVLTIVAVLRQGDAARRCRVIANERYLDNTPEIPDSEHNSPEPGDRRPMPSEGRGHWFESSRVHHLFNDLAIR